MLSAQQVARLHGKVFNYVLTGSLPGSVGGAPGTAPLSKQVDSAFHFLSEAIYSTYNTLSAVGVDSGTNTISAQFRAAQTNFFLSDDFIDLACIAAPGRQRTVGVAGDPSQQLHIAGLPWFYPYPAGSNISVDLRNTSTQALTPFLDFKGYIIPVSEFPTIEDVMRVLAEYDPGYGVPSNAALMPGGPVGPQGRYPGSPFPQHR